ADRLRGFRDALRAEGITVPKEWVVRSGGEISGGDEGALRVLDGIAADRGPPGVFFYNDRGAAGGPPPPAPRVLYEPNRVVRRGGAKPSGSRRGALDPPLISPPL
ncbi:hypothetical protein TN53_43675, partial [Streptomyces sp. WM6386]